MPMRRWMWILWPAFLAAGVMEMLVFAVFDPQDMLWLGQGVEWSRWAIYTVAFFVFWVVLAVACGLTVLLAMPAAMVNGQWQAPSSAARDWAMQESLEACYPNNA